MHRATWDTERLLEPFDYGPITLFGRNFHSVRLGLGVLKSVPLPRRDKSLRFGLFRFRSPLLTESRLFSTPPDTEMFHFSGCCEPPPMDSGRDDAVLKAPGYPIRKSPDHSSFDSYPRLIAAYYVLHRSFAPRHSPYALNLLYIEITILFSFKCATTNTVNTCCELDLPIQQLNICTNVWYITTRESKL